ncbi:MAG: hypothetical protein KF746_02890 [Chitinophagaceae bacterium]|nr:hypothetical protein [Chitinophagaceae bacterium]
MPENDFEKQVQQIFSDMKLKPSEAVWPKVQEKITREKKRRRVLFWLPALLLLLAGGGYWIAGEGGKDFSQKATSEEVNAVTAVNEREEAGSTVNGEPAASGSAQNSNSISTPEANSRIPEAALAVDAAKAGIANADNKKGSADIAVVKPSGNGSVFNSNNGSADRNGVAGALKTGLSNKNVVTSKSIDAERTSGDMQKEEVKNNEDQTSLAGSQNAAGKPVTGTYQQVNGYNGLKDADSEKELKNFIWENNKAVVKLGKRKSWEWGISAQAGISTVGRGLSDIFKDGLFEKSGTDYQLSQPSPDMSFVGSAQNNYLVAAPPPASPVKTGLAWSAGGFGKWYVKEKLALSFGAAYSLYTTERKVGNVLIFNQQNNAVFNANARFAGYYPSSNGAIDYTNRYHFVQVPLGIQWQINKGIRLPLQLDVGLALGYLVNTTAVHYNSQTGVYYADDGLFNKFQTGIYTGISAKLFQHSRRPLYVGPMVQYNFSDLTKPSSGSKQNLKYAGLKMQWVLWKD